MKSENLVIRKAKADGLGVRDFASVENGEESDAFGYGDPLPAHPAAELYKKYSGKRK